ncbi:hypothetical protein AVEN_63019-1 [Araneus ventricosus]|uniref:Uncharacterized protein n=1 Tax=Araneus ventricosus TaxID=182803 RepID=A0A4Y2CSD6_ARAVE|nr:hypothetical protein AVEN_63019-1 [Araneus ventricosus]
MSAGVTKRQHTHQSISIRFQQLECKQTALHWVHIDFSSGVIGSRNHIINDFPVTFKLDTGAQVNVCYLYPSHSKAKSTINSPNISWKCAHTLVMLLPVVGEVYFMCSQQSAS